MSFKKYTQGVPSGKCQRGEFVYLLWNVPIQGHPTTMNDFPVIGDVSFEQRIVGSPGGKHCKSLERNVWRRVVSYLKKVILDKE